MAALSIIDAVLPQEGRCACTSEFSEGPRKTTRPDLDQEKAGGLSRATHPL